MLYQSTDFSVHRFDSEYFYISYLPTDEYLCKDNQIHNTTNIVAGSIYNTYYRNGFYKSEEEAIFTINKFIATHSTIIKEL